MKINFHISTKNHDLTPQITADVHEKLGVIERYIDTDGDREILAEVEIGLDSFHHQKGDIYRAEINLSNDGVVHRATANGSSVNEALDLLKDEIVKQIRRSKNKKGNLFLKGARKIKEMFRK